MSVQDITFDALSAIEFENLVYDLLNALGLRELNWRKGTGCETSPADQGRDVECLRVATGPDGSIEIEKWFVQCKHYKRGVPADALAGALVWAQAERPSRLVFVVSNFLSNQAKEYLRSYEEKNRPSFKISMWELPKLRELTGIHTQILRKYGLLGEFPLLSILHPCHIRYLQMPPPNTLNYLFDLLDELTPTERRDCLDWIMIEVVNPPFSDPPPDYKGTFGELMIDKVDYPTFKDKCYALARLVAPGFVVSAVVNGTLQYLLQLGDLTSIGRVLQNINDSISRFRQQIAEGDPESGVVAGLIEMLEESRASLPDKTRHYYHLYTTFCEKVVGPLFDERIVMQMPEHLRRPTKGSTSAE